MADDASGGDGDRGELSSTDPDVDYPDDGTPDVPGEGDWPTIEREFDADDPDDEYRIPLDLSGTESDGDDAADRESDLVESEDDPYAPEPSSTPIEAGDPSLESAVFVLLGAIAMILVLFRIVSVAM